MSLTRTPQRALASITSASGPRSSSASSSASPEPLHLSELSTDAVDGDAAETLPPTTEEPTAAFEPGRILLQGNQSQTSQLQPGNRTRQGAIGGHLEEADVPTEASRRQQDTRAPSVGHEESSVRCGCASARGAPEEASPAPSGHVSHVRLTLSPRTSSPIPRISSPHADAPPARRPEDLLPVRRRPSASSPDEGVGSSSPPEWCSNTEPMRRHGPCALYRTADRLTPATHGEEVSPRPPTPEAAGRQVGLGRLLLW